MFNPYDYIGYRLLDLQEALAGENKIVKIVVFVQMEEYPEVIFRGTIYELYNLIGWFVLERCVIRAHIHGDACYATIDINEEGEEF